MELVLTRSYIYRGRHYGPGPVDAPADVAEALARREANLAPAPASPPTEPTPTHTPPGELPTANPAVQPQTGDPIPEELELAALASVTDQVARALWVSGVKTESDLRTAGDEQLLAVAGIGPATLRAMRMELDMIAERAAASQANTQASDLSDGPTADGDSDTQDSDSAPATDDTDDDAGDED